MRSSTDPLSLRNEIKPTPLLRVVCHESFLSNIILHLFILINLLLLAFCSVTTPHNRGKNFQIQLWMAERCVNQLCWFGVWNCGVLTTLLMVSPEIWLQLARVAAIFCRSSLIHNAIHVYFVGKRCFKIILLSWHTVIKVSIVRESPILYSYHDTLHAGQFRSQPPRDKKALFMVRNVTPLTAQCLILLFL